MLKVGLDVKVVCPLKLLLPLISKVPAVIPPALKRPVAFKVPVVIPVLAYKEPVVIPPLAVIALVAVKVVVVKPPFAAKGPPIDESDVVVGTANPLLKVGVVLKVETPLNVLSPSTFKLPVEFTVNPPTVKLLGLKLVGA